MTVGQRIKQRRKQLNMSAEELAAKIGRSPATMYRYEKYEWGSRGREFKSLHPDQKSPENTAFSGLSHFWIMAENGIKL